MGALNRYCTAMGSDSDARSPGGSLQLAGPGRPGSERAIFGLPWIRTPFRGATSAAEGALPSLSLDSQVRLSAISTPGTQRDSES